MIDRSFDVSFSSVYSFTTEPDPISMYPALAKHLDRGDYFRYLATILGFFEESCTSPETTSDDMLALQAEAARALREELLFLHTHYRIMPA